MSSDKTEYTGMYMKYGRLQSINWMEWNMGKGGSYYIEQAWRKQNANRFQHGNAVISTGFYQWLEYRRAYLLCPNDW